LAEQINSGLEWCDVYIPILSAASLTSQWCMEEINAAITLSNNPRRVGRPRIIPVLIEPCEDQMPALLQGRLFIQFAGRYDEALQELKVRGLEMPTQMAAAPATLPQTTPKQTATPPPRVPTRSAQHSSASWAITGGLIGIIFVLLLICFGMSIYAFNVFSKAPATYVAPGPTRTPTMYVDVTPSTTASTAPTPATPNPTTVTPSLTPTWTPSPTPTWTPSLTPTRNTPVPACSGPPVISYFNANPDTMEVLPSLTGQSTLSWGPGTNATSVVIDQGIGNVALTGSKVVTLGQTTTYTLVATGCGGTITKQVTITVKLKTLVIVLPTAPPIFFDDFSSPGLPGWTPLRSNWSNPGGYMRGDQVNCDGMAVRNVQGSNFTYEGTLTLANGNAVGLTFRSSADGKFTYHVFLDSVARVFKISKEPPYTVLRDYGMTVQLNRPYKVKVVANGNLIEAYLDGEKRLTVNDSSYSNGYFGVTLFCSTVMYDDLKAWNLQ
jgi:hypothetical protein